MFGPHLSERGPQPKVWGWGQSVALPGTSDHRDEPGCTSPGLSELPPGPPNSHTHTRADLGPCVSTTLATPRVVTSICVGRSLPSGVLPR